MPKVCANTNNTKDFFLLQLVPTIPKIYGLQTQHTKIEPHCIDLHYSSGSLAYVVPFLTIK